LIARDAPMNLLSEAVSLGEAEEYRFRNKG
jgi:hypothetical protein